MDAGERVAVYVQRFDILLQLLFRLPHQFLFARLHGTRATRRPKLRWVGNVTADVSKLGLAIVEAMRVMEEIREAVRACNFCIAMTLKKK